MMHSVGVRRNPGHRGTNSNVKGTGTWEEGWGIGGD